MMKLIPERDRLLIELEPVKEKTVAKGKKEDGGDYEIIVPDKHHERVRHAVILAIGKPAIPEDEGRYSIVEKILVGYHVGRSGIIVDYAFGWLDDCHRIIRYDEVLGKIIG